MLLTVTVKNPPMVTVTMKVLLLLALWLVLGDAQHSTPIFEDDSDVEGDPEEIPPTSFTPTTIATSATQIATTYRKIKTTNATTPSTTTVPFFHLHVASTGALSNFTASNTTDDMFGKNVLQNVRLIYDDQIRYPTGIMIRSDSFYGKSVVLLPPESFISNGYTQLRVTKDYMQTALDAFGIILMGSVKDVLAMPPQYLLNSARTISMMKISREKLEAVWTVVKQNRHPANIPYETIERFRPLFKHVPAHDMADMNMKDPKILNYLGTHPDIDRHQAGLIASRFVKLNPHWETARIFNQMNNLICGLPIITMRHVKIEIYMQLSEQLFYHVNACDKLQKKFFLGMMSQTQVLGKAHSWNARDIMRLGLLLPELSGRQLSTINPRAMIGLTAKVMMEMHTETLQYMTVAQVRQLSSRSYNIYQLKMKQFKESLIIDRSARATAPSLTTLVLLSISVL